MSVVASQLRFADALIAWQQRAGRHDLPWQGTTEPYRIWVSEIMLQQTQVGTVIDRYRVFMDQFPTVGHLAAADLESVLGCWSGLGYYSRARNLHAAARLIMTEHHGRFPPSAQALAQLPGIGRSTAAAIAVFSGTDVAAILDGNVNRVLARAFAIEGWSGQSAVQQHLWQRAESELPRELGIEALRAYTQGLMDLGATICLPRRPRCEDCPIAARCAARATGRVATLPTPRPARIIALRVADWALILQGARVLLQARPSRGLWGGLWALPEIRSPATPSIPALELPDSEVLDWIRAQRDLKGLTSVRDTFRPLIEPVRHVFTHFRLEARVWPMRLPSTGHDAAPEGMRWLALNPQDIAAAPLPTPVRRLLEGLLSQLREHPAD
ncbi:MAG: A/G-specific adenine glycosylase [Burkholderiales bacterium]